MRRRVAWAALAAVVWLAEACGAPAPGGDVPEAGAGAEAVPADSTAAASAAAAIPVDSASGGPVTAAPGDAPTPGAPAQGSGGVPQMPTGEKPRLVRLQDILAGEAQPGERVRVEGLCIGYARVVAAGPQPRTRSDWQLVQGDAAVWVAGPYPAGCSGTEPAQRPGTYTVVVGVDTLPALGGAPPRPRVYLVHTPPE